MASKKDLNPPVIADDVRSKVVVLLLLTHCLMLNETFYMHKEIRSGQRIQRLRLVTLNCDLDLEHISKGSNL